VAFFIVSAKVAIFIGNGNNEALILRLWL